MKKSSFATMILGTVGGLFFAIGMCMCLLPAWGAFIPGVIMGIIGAVLLLATLITWRKSSGRSIGLPLYSIAGVILFGIGMSIVVAGSKIALGIIIGIIGMVMLISLVPILKGVH